MSDAATQGGQPPQPSAEPARAQGSASASAGGLLEPSARTVTLVEGSSFCLSNGTGDIVPERADGLFVQDTRILSRWELLIDGRPVDGLAALPAEPYTTTFVGRAAPRPNRSDSTLVVERTRFVGTGMREDLVLRNFGTEPAGVDITLLVDADFADLFDVKDNRKESRWRVVRRGAGGEVQAWTEGTPSRRGVRVVVPGAVASNDALAVRAIVPAHGSWTTTIEVVASIDTEELETPFPSGGSIENAPAAQRMRGWRERDPQLRATDEALDVALTSALRDLGALRIIDPRYPDDQVVAAGAPWFMALFGRDSLLTAWMALPYAPALAMGTLRALARLQGTQENPMTEEQPGKIPHEVRLGADERLALGGDRVYYGSVDATPLFVALVGRALRWGAPLAEIERLLGHVGAAADWMVTFGDSDGDGFVEYKRSTDRGLVNQGWKDSFDAISFADGQSAQPPIALAEVQGYVYAAHRAHAEILRAFGREGDARTADERAEKLRNDFHEAFWLAERGYYAMALDGSKRPVDVLSSNIGHCLWTGIAAPQVADQVVDHLVSASMFTGFGIRTLSTDAATYNPVSYHNGSVWPHDTVLCAAGIARYGRRADAARVVRGLLDASAYFGGRMPELFCGFDRGETTYPVPYPTSCSPQAWAAASPYEIVSMALDLDVVDGRPTVGVTPEGLGAITIERLAVGDQRFAVSADVSTATVRDLRAGAAPHEVR